MARSTRITDKINYANFENNQTLTDAEREALAEFPGLGYYSRTSLDDIINNFIVAYIGEGKMLTKVPRHEVAFWAQRGTQEFSYDTLHSENNIEIELGPSLSMPLPGDYVNYVKFVRVDEYGRDRTIYPERVSTAKQGALQDDGFNYIYDDQGEITYAGKSISAERFQQDNLDSNLREALRNQITRDETDSIYDYYYSGYYGRRYGLDPEFANVNGSFHLDLVAGIVYFDSTFQEGDIIGLRYISDGLTENGDLSKVYFPKLAEDALYAYILYNLMKVRATTAAAAPAYKKEMSAKMRNAKIRLTNYKQEEITQVLRGRAKWIKH